MEANGWRPAQGDPPVPGGAAGGVGGVEGGPPVEWRSTLQPEARQRIVNKIMDTLKKHLPIPGSEGIIELKQIAMRFEEKIFTSASCQSDYLRKISLKMLSMETKTPGMNPGPQPSNVIGSQNKADSGSTLGVRQPLIPQNLVNNTASTSLQGSAGMQVTLPSISGLTQSSISNAGQPSSLQNISGMSQAPINSSAGQGAASNVFANAQRQVQGRQQQQTLTSQQQQSHNSLMYQNAIQPQLLKPKMPHPSLLQSQIQQQQQQQQQSLLQSTQLQSSQQQSLMQMSSSIQSGQSTIQQPQSAMSAPQSGLQQAQQSPMQQSMPSLLPQHSQSTVRQQHIQPVIHQQASSLQQQSTAMSQQILSQQQQQQLMVGQQANMSGMQGQLLGQQNSADVQQQQQQRLPGQSNNLLGMQRQQMLNPQNISMQHHQQQLGAQSNISGLQQQQQQPLGSQPNLSNVQTLQRTLNMQQNKTATQQQNQQLPMTMLQSQGQQTQNAVPQQQLMPQIQSQSTHMQQQMAMQQQANSIQRELQNRLQASGALFQSQNAIDQQKQFIQTQRGIPEISSTSLDSTAQTGHGGGVDWQEEIYQKIKSMKEMYLTDLTEVHQKVALKLHQHENAPAAARQSDQYKKLEQFKILIERSIQLLQTQKSSINSPNLRDKIPIYENQIINFLSSNRRKIPPQPSVQQQLQPPTGLPMSQQNQISQLQQHDGHINQVQQMSLQGSGTSMQPGASTIQLASIPLSQLGVPMNKQSISNMTQAGNNLDQTQSNNFGALQGSVNPQQGGMGSLPNSLNVSQQNNIGSLSQNSLSTLQNNAGVMPQGPSMLQQPQHLKQVQEQQLLQSQQMKQQSQQRQMQQHLMHQKHQLLQQPALQQQLLQPKQHQAGQLPVHQLANQINEMNDMKLRQASNAKTGLQHHSQGQRHNYFHPQLKASSYPISPQNPQASSPQISQHPSPQIDHGLPPVHPKAGTPLQSSNSPLVVRSPSTPIAPSPMPGDSEKQSISSLPNIGAIGHQTGLTPQSQSIAVGTPGISASPLLAEFTSPDGNQGNAPAVISSKSAIADRPFDQLINAVQSASPHVLKSAVNDIGAVVSMIDRFAGSAPGNGSRAAIGEDLAAITKCRLQARNFMSQDGGASTKKMKRHTSAMPLNAVSSVSSVIDSFMASDSLDTSEQESTASSNNKRQKFEVSHALLEEIREINQKLIETVVIISNEDADSFVSVAGGEGTLVKFSFSAVACSPSLKSHFASAQMSPIMPLGLLVPVSYPKSSPVVLDKFSAELSQECEDLSAKARSKFNASLRALSQPMLLKDMAKTWDVCARKVIVEYAEQMGGGSFSSRYGTWEVLNA